MKTFLKIPFQNGWTEISQIEKIKNCIDFTHMPRFRTRQADFRNYTQLLHGAMVMRKWKTAGTTAVLHMTASCVVATNSGQRTAMVWEIWVRFREIYITEEFLILEKNSRENCYKQRGLRQRLLPRNEDSQRHRHTFSRWKWVVPSLLYPKYMVCGSKVCNFSNIFMEWKQYYLVIKGNFSVLTK